MKRLIELFFIIFVALTINKAKGENSKVDYSALPREIESGPQGKNHVQGIAVDLKNGHIYFSFTTSLLKTDLNGKLLGSVTGMVGHLGCLSFDETARKLYASLEYKNDVIGQGILKRANAEGRKNETAFYVAVFDVDSIDRIGMDAEKDGIMKTVHIKEATDDYNAKFKDGDKELEHRFGCSGIDGVTVGPEIGGTNPENKYLYVAYGIYGDTTRVDNDNQVILAYDLSSFDRYGKPLSQDSAHRSGPDKPQHKYFLYTGNTSWGIQNLAYDKSSGNIFAAVYCGNKSKFPNFSHFLINGKSKPKKGKIQGVNYEKSGELLSLVKSGIYHPQSDTWGWNFKYGSTGISPIGNGYFYISQSYKDPETQDQSSTVKLYKWTGNPEEPFIPVD